jgi:hypothetical protein
VKSTCALLLVLLLFVSVLVVQNAPAQASARTEVYHVHFAKATLGKGAEEGDFLKQPNPVHESIRVPSIEIAGSSRGRISSSIDRGLGSDMLDNGSHHFDGEVRSEVARILESHGIRRWRKQRGIGLRGFSVSCRAGAS